MLRPTAFARKSRATSGRSAGTDDAGPRFLLWVLLPPLLFARLGVMARAQDMRRTGIGTRRASHRRVPRVSAWRFVVLLDEVLERGVPVPRVRRLEEGPNSKHVFEFPYVFFPIRFQNLIFNFSDCRGLWGRPKGGRRGRRVRRPSCPSKASDLHDPSCGRIYPRFRCCWIYFCCYFCCCCWIYLFFCCCCCCWIYFCTAPRCARYARQVRVSHMRERGLSFLPSVGPTGPTGPTGLSCLPSVGTFDCLQAGCDAPGGRGGDRGRIVPVLPSRPVPRGDTWDAGRWVAAR